MPGLRSLVTQVRQDPTTRLIVTLTTNLPVDIQDGGDGAPTAQAESFLVPGAVYSPHTLYIRRVLGLPLPDVRVGDGFVDLGDLDAMTGRPATYDVTFRRRWTNHVEVSARKAQVPGDLVALNARTLASYNQSATWLARITSPTDPDRPTAGATRTAGYDPASHQVMAHSDGALGVGWQTTQNAVLRLGYLAPQQISVGINDAQRLEEQGPDGLILYNERTVVYYTPPTALRKGDVLAVGAQRYVVGDHITTPQVYGVDVLRTATLEPRASDDPIYQLSLT